MRRSKESFKRSCVHKLKVGLRPSIFQSSKVFCLSKRFTETSKVLKKYDIQLFCYYRLKNMFKMGYLRRTVSFFADKYAIQKTIIISSKLVMFYPTVKCKNRSTCILKCRMIRSEQVNSDLYYINKLCCQNCLDFGNRCVRWVCSKKIDFENSILPVIGNKHKINKCYRSHISCDI